MLAVLLCPVLQDPPQTLPPPAAETLTRTFPGTRLGEVRVREFLGLKLYEAVVGESEATVSGDGTLAAIDAPAGPLPPPVTESATKISGGGKILEARRIETRARLAFPRLPRPVQAYDLSISRDGRQGALQVAADGTVLRPLVWEKAREEKREPEVDRPQASGESALPAAALAAIRKAFPDPAINEVESILLPGTVVYDVEVISRAGERQVHVAHDGTLLSVDQDAPASSLPPPVLDSAARAAGGAPDSCMARRRDILVSASLVRLDVPDVRYRVVIPRGGGRALLVLGPDGALLVPPVPLPAAAIDDK